MPRCRRPPQGVPTNTSNQPARGARSVLITARGEIGAELGVVLVVLQLLLCVRVAPPDGHDEAERGALGDGLDSQLLRSTTKNSCRVSARHSAWRTQGGCADAVSAHETAPLSLRTCRLVHTTDSLAAPPPPPPCGRERARGTGLRSCLLARGWVTERIIKRGAGADPLPCMRAPAPSPRTLPCSARPSAGAAACCGDPPTWFWEQRQTLSRFSYFF